MTQKGERLQTAMQLWILGDYFRVESLCEEVEDFLDGCIVPSILESARENDLSVDLKDWVAAGRLVYDAFPGTISHNLRDTFLTITLGYPELRKPTLQTPEFKALCLEYRDFGSDSMLKLLEDGIIVPQ
ncbi:hypothetical protein LZ31DRAFT_621653 [Colletotrichum somersetense]|nr:hypothetical protein LZ31DRAFT_621653 [Colletotrichum somersetense]